MTEQYTPATCVFFEAALADWPTILLEWLAEDLPTLEDMVPNKNGMLDKDSIEWKTMVNRAQPEKLPDYCIYCNTSFDWIPGGQLREGCPKCIENFPAAADSTLLPLLRIGLSLAAATDHKYFPELIEYLFLLHIRWRDYTIVVEQNYDEINQVATAKVSKPSLKDKLKP
jgi:hypothetical protein